MDTELYRSRIDAVIGGVCGGLGATLGINSTYVRIFFVLLAMGNGIGILIYFLLWMIIPLEGRYRGNTLQENVRINSHEIAARARAFGEDISYAVRPRYPNTGMAVGITLVALGILYALDVMNLPSLNWIDFDMFWPFLLISGGLALLFRRTKGT